jgi:hypothetical protein
LYDFYTELMSFLLNKSFCESEIIDMNA